MRVSAEHRGGSGEPLLLLHGFTDTWRAWTPLLDGLESVHEVLAPTLPGHYGADDLPSGRELTAGAVADVLERRMDAAGWPTAHIAGSSLGGWLALELASRGRARSVVALCPLGGWEHDSRQARRAYRYFLRSHRSLELLPPGLMRQIAARPRLRAFALRELVVHPEHVSPQAALNMMEGARGCRIVVEGIELARRGAALGQLTGVDCPVRIAYGERDWLIPWPSAYGRLQHMFGEAEFVALPDCGHLPMWDHPELVTRRILEVSRAAGPVPAPPVGT